MSRKRNRRRSKSGHLIDDLQGFQLDDFGIGARLETMKSLILENFLTVWIFTSKN